MKKYIVTMRQISETVTLHSIKNQLSINQRMILYSTTFEIKVFDFENERRSRVV